MADSDNRIRAKYEAFRLSELGRHGEARAQFIELLAHDPEDSGLWQMLGFTLVCLRDFTGAERAYKNALQLRGDDARSLAGLGDCYSRAGSHRRAKDVMDQARALEPLDSWVLGRDIAVDFRRSRRLTKNRDQS